MHLLERDHALAALRQDMAAVRDCEGRLVLIAGEAGVGKSALLDRFREEMPDALWASGACDGLFIPRPLGPLYDIAEQLGGDLLAACRRGAPRDELFAVLIRQISMPGQCAVLSIEDVHWADESTLDLLRFLGRRIHTVAVLLLVTYRDDALAPNDPLRITLGALATQRGSRRVSLAPLSEDAVAVLAADSAIGAAEVHRLTGGNPFFVAEVLQAGSTRVPASARDAVLSRVAHLSDAARYAMEVAALGGHLVEPTVLAAIDVSASDLDELICSGVLISDATSLRFRHEITRLAIEGQLAAHRRRPIHARLLDVLRRAGSEDDACLAFHAEGSSDREAVLLFATAAGHRAASLGAHREAVAQYERVLRFAADGADEGAAAFLADINSRLAKQASLIDRWNLAVEAGERALTLWRAAGDPVQEGDSLRQLSRITWRLCRGRESVAYARAAVDLLETVGETPELARAYAQLATTHLHRSQRDCGIALARKARTLAQNFRLADVVADTLGTVACICFVNDEQWLPGQRRSLAAALDARAYEVAARAYANMHVALTASKRFAEAEAVAAEGTAFCEEHDMLTFGRCLRATDGELLLSRGRWDEALEIGRQLLAIGASPFNRITPALVVGRVLARRGDQAAWMYFDEAIASADGTGRSDMRAEVHPTRAEAHWLAGDVDAAVDDIAVAATGADSVDEWGRGQILTWQRRLGVAVSGTAGSVAETHARSLEGDFGGAAELWDKLGCPYDAALALFDSGTECGLRDALRRFDALGALAAARMTRGAMRRLGIRSIPVGAHPATRSHPAGLTRREREVLALICARLSNPEISQRLVLSPRTVEHHVSSVLSKLGASSRAAAATEAGRLGLVERT